MDGSGCVVQKHWRATLERVEKFLSDTYFTDSNLRGRLYPEHSPLVSLKWYRAGGQVAYCDAVTALEDAPEVVGQSISIGPTWSTHWFRCEAVVPPEWSGRHVRLRWDSSCEAMVWIDGEPVQGLTGSSDTHQIRTDFTLTKSALGGEKYVMYIEAVGNGMFGAGREGLINPPDPVREFPLKTAELAVFDEDVYGLLTDLTVIYDMAKHLSQGSPRAYEALYAANEIVNLCDPFNRDTFTKCREVSSKFLSEKNGDSQHIIHAMGHCHIDSAWLWPYSESVRKCGRSWSSVIRLMEDYPNLTFVCSQAQQLEWVKEHYPGLYAKIKARASSGQFIPAGGSWVEMDGNIPSGESFVRQFVIGQAFFKQEFGHTCKEFWLPDTFGYSAQLPQVMAGAGISHFLTQKLSWNLTNKFQHNSFHWEGLDGTSVLVHFPPADTYQSPATVEDLLKTVCQFKDKGRSRSSVLLYGHGDGGGGPTEDMLEMLQRLSNVDGLPRVQHSTPQQFFTTLEQQDAGKLCRWVGELYLELHRATYTTHAKIKKENRQGEFLLHDVDFITAINFTCHQDLVMCNAVKTEMLPLWKKFLLNQFHDVLPGSCIEQVAIDAVNYYEEVKVKATDVLYKELDSIIPKFWERSQTKYPVVVNTFSWCRCEVVRVVRGEGGDVEEVPGEPKRARLQLEGMQTLHDGTTVALVVTASMSMGQLNMVQPHCPATVTKLAAGSFALENAHIRAVLSAEGLLQSLLHKETQREAVALDCFGNQFVLFDDIPLFWDAWDVMEYHLETRKPVCQDGLEACVLDAGPLRVSIEFKYSISKCSDITQCVVLDADCPFLRFDTKVNWHERHKFLKVEFPLNVRAHEAKYEIQFGHIARPNHYNTTWDQAKFEVCGHKWGDLSEHGFGVALLNDCKYGYSTLANIMRLSLLRSSKAPDGNADMGLHSFTYAIMPHKGSLQESGVIREGYNINHPLRILSTSFTVNSVKSFFSIDNPAIVLETVKTAERGDSSAIVLRLYEAFGGHAQANLTSSCLSIKQYQRCNLLEEPVDPPQAFSGDIALSMRPFEVATLMLYL